MFSGVPHYYFFYFRIQFKLVSIALQGRPILGQLISLFNTPFRCTGTYISTCKSTEEIK